MNVKRMLDTRGTAAAGDPAPAIETLVFAKRMQPSNS